MRFFVRELELHMRSVGSGKAESRKNTMKTTPFTDKEIAILAVVAAAEYVANAYDREVNLQKWREERSLQDLRSVQWGTYAHSWALYKRVFEAEVDARLEGKSEK